MQYPSVSIRQLAKKLAKFDVRPNSIIAVKEDSVLGQKDNLDALMSVLEQTGIENVIVVVVRDFDDIKTLDEQEMAKNGWFKVETLQNAILRTRKTEKKHEQPDKIL